MLVLRCVIEVVGVGRAEEFALKQLEEKVAVEESALTGGRWGDPLDAGANSSSNSSSSASEIFALAAER